MAQRTLQADLDALADVERPEGLEIATLTHYDIPAMAALHLVAYDRPTVAENLWEVTDEMRMAFDGAFGATRDDSFIGAWFDGELVGALLCVTDAALDDVPRGPFVTDLMVDPEYRRRGIATALVGELSRRCAQWGYDSVALRIDQRLAGADKLYEILGFDEVATDTDTDTDTDTETDPTPALTAPPGTSAS